jgi:hypothetical protein
VKPSDIEFFIRAFIFGVTIYTVEFILYAAIGWPFTIDNFEDAATREIVKKDVVREILVALAIGLILSIVWLRAA